MDSSYLVIVIEVVLHANVVCSALAKKVDKYTKQILLLDWSGEYSGVAAVLDRRSTDCKKSCGWEASKKTTTWLHGLHITINVTTIVWIRGRYLTKNAWSINKEPSSTCTYFLHIFYKVVFYHLIFIKISFVRKEY